MMELTLTPDQVAFMVKHHFEIETSSIDPNDPHSSSLYKLMHSDEYREIFGDMLLDDAIDRFEDRPEYDPTLRNLVKIRQLIEHSERAQWTVEQLQSQIHQCGLDNAFLQRSSGMVLANLN